MTERYIIESATNRPVYRFVGKYLKQAHQLQEDTLLLVFEKELAFYSLITLKILATYKIGGLE